MIYIHISRLTNRVNMKLEETTLYIYIYIYIYICVCVCSPEFYLDMKPPTTAAMIAVGSPRMAETIKRTAPPAI